MDKRMIMKKYGTAIIFTLIIVFAVFFIFLRQALFIGKAYDAVASQHISMAITAPDNIYAGEDFTVIVNLRIQDVPNGVLVAAVVPDNFIINNAYPKDVIVLDNTVMWTLSNGEYDLLINLTSSINGSFELEAKYGTYIGGIVEERKAGITLDVIEKQAFCGDNICSGDETCNSCSQDCGQCCGNGVCDYGERCDSCPQDCGTCAAACGNGICEAGESCSSCPSDCGTDPSDESCFGVSCAPDECCEGGMCWRVDPCAGVECGPNEHPVQTGPGPGECTCMPD